MVIVRYPIASRPVQKESHALVLLQLVPAKTALKHELQVTGAISTSVRPAVQVLRALTSALAAISTSAIQYTSASHGSRRAISFHNLVPLRSDPRFEKLLHKYA